MIHYRKEKRVAARRTRNQLEAAACHEAGHAVIAFFLGDGVRKKAVSIVADEGTAVHVHSRATLGAEGDSRSRGIALPECVKG